MKYIIKFIILKFIKILPMKKNKIVFMSFEGKQYSCNPKAITEYLLKENRLDYKIIWVFKNPKDYKELNENIKKVKYKSISYFYHLYTSNILISNTRTPNHYYKKKRQIYIQTWHSFLGLKKIEGDAKSFLSEDYIKNAKKDSEKCDLMIIGCQKREEIFRRAFWYKGEFLKKGTPRNDLLFDDNIERKIKSKFNITAEYINILYAPTFRKNRDYKLLDFNNLLSIKGKKIKIFIKLHPSYNGKEEYIYNENLINASSYDIQELVLCTDILITDYSSVMFDYALKMKKCILYLPDIDIYTNSERDFYFDIKTLPFLKVYSEEDIIQAVFEENNYQQEIIRFLEEINSYEKGECCKSIVEWIDRKREFV